MTHTSKKWQSHWILLQLGDFFDFFHQSHWLFSFFKVSTIFWAVPKKRGRKIQTRYLFIFSAFFFSGLQKKNSKKWWWLDGDWTGPNAVQVRSTLRQFVRDWAKEGQAERAASYSPLISALLKHLPAKGALEWLKFDSFALKRRGFYHQKGAERALGLEVFFFWCESSRWTSSGVKKMTCWNESVGYVFCLEAYFRPLFLKENNPPKQGRTSNQNKGPHLGSRCIHKNIYIYISFHHLSHSREHCCSL